MTFIKWAINNKLHKYDDEAVQSQTWELFADKAHGKKVFLFGTGAGMEYFFRNCCRHMEIAGVIDNEKSRQGQKLGWYSAEVWRTEYEDIVISGPDILEQYDKQDIVVLVTSVSYYGGILEQLKQMEVENCFVLLIMEADKRAKDNNFVEEDFPAYKERFVQWCCEQGIEPHKIVMQIGEYGGHARQITKQLLKMTEDLDLVWIVNSLNAEAPAGVRLVYENNWKRYIYEMETAKIWLFDIMVPDFIQKRETQIYIQAKHWSSITLKKFYLDDKSTCTSHKAELQMRNDGKRMDYLLSGSEMDEASCRSGFAFEGEAVRVGSARSDVLFDAEAKEKVFAELGLDKEVHTVLYAPTFRKEDVNRGSSESVYLDAEGLLRALADKTGGEWRLLLRLHPHLASVRNELWERQEIINVSAHPDCDELVAACDVMVTDYSSIMFEGAFIKKPVFLYAPDWQEYIGGEREFLLDYNTLPFPVSKTNEELAICVETFDQRKYQEAVTAFLDHYGVCEDGNAGKRAAAFISSLIRRNQ